MASDLTAGIFAVLGTVLGGGVTLATNAFSARTQAQQAEAVRVHEVEQARRARIDARAAELDNVRRDACVKFLSLAATFRDVADEYGWMLEAPSTEATARTKDRYMQAWADFSASTAPIQIAGPPELADAAVALRDCVGDYSLDLDRQARGGKPARGHDAKNVRMNEARDTFAAIAQGLFDPAVPEGSELGV